ncbi:hypothetical protein SCHPADRAFT_203362 [Schizopora paradoxa]|uniref:Uncharacterized protein n=1 Tax=Schizopora paradoxa TaxID=27342 RepID=A0A0H2S4T4_9AGAM|nr:hypothetical protein SCHPADRAFT_203362 [Schizopora paradoxa]
MPADSLPILDTRSLLDTIITNDDGYNAREGDFNDVALDIHTRLRLDETSIIERHMSPFARYNILAKEEPLQTACAKLSKYAKSGFASLPTRVSALKAICILTVEHPYIRRVWKECNKTCSRLQRLADTSGKPRIKEWARIALDAIREEDVHMLWSNVITEPIYVCDVEQITNLAACDRADLAELQNTLRDPKTSFVAGLYLERVTKLAKDGPSEQAIEVIGDHLRLAQQYDAAPTDTSTLRNLCMKLLKYARCPSTAVAAMEKIVVLTVDNPPQTTSLSFASVQSNLYTPSKTKIFTPCGRKLSKIPLLGAECSNSASRVTGTRVVWSQSWRSLCESRNRVLWPLSMSNTRGI